MNDSYEATGEMYNRVIRHLLQESRAAAAAAPPYVVVATHNEKGVWHAADIVRREGIDPRGGDVVFGQIYGMGEQISLPLGEQSTTVTPGIMQKLYRVTM